LIQYDAVSLGSPGPNDRLIWIQKGELHGFLSRFWRHFGVGIPNRRPVSESVLNEMAGMGEAVELELSADTIGACISVQL
jgi:hypothetical protein